MAMREVNRVYQSGKFGNSCGSRNFACKILGGGKCSTLSRIQLQIQLESVDEAKFSVLRSHSGCPLIMTKLHLFEDPSLRHSC
jgi:hypothetical protein